MSLGWLNLSPDRTTKQDMSDHSRAEFASLTGVKTKDLAVYIRRGKVVVVDGKIDDKHPTNALFMSKRALKTIKSEVQKPEKKPQSETPSPPSDVLVELAKRKAELELTRRENEILMQKHNLQKKRGELVPVAAVKSLITLHTESIKTAYMQASDNLLIVINAKKQLTATELSLFRKEFTSIVNKAVDIAIESTSKSLVSIASEYSKKRGVGEHE
jgi:hypothetical protein